MSKFFNLQKNNKEKDTQPDYKISFQTNDTFVEAGACWKKTDKNGNTFLSCKFGDAYKERKGYHIAEDAVEGSVGAKSAPQDDL